VVGEVSFQTAVVEEWRYGRERRDDESDQGSVCQGAIGVSAAVERPNCAKVQAHDGEDWALMAYYSNRQKAAHEAHG